MTVFEQGEAGVQIATGHLRGRQSGRVSPRPAIRQPRHEAVMVSHGLMESGQGDHNQHALFDTTPYTRSVGDLVQEHQLTTPLPSSRPGFLPGIEGRATPTKAHKAVAEQRGVAPEDVARRAAKADVVRRYGDLRSVHPVPEASPEQGPVGQAYSRRVSLARNANSYFHGESPSWYSHTDERGHVVEGEAQRLLRDASFRAGTTVNEMTRAAAITSPRTAWTDSNVLYRSYPNLDSAVNVAKAIAPLRGLNIDVKNVREVGASAPGTALGERKALAAEDIHSADKTSPIRSGKNYGKVPNFNESMHLGQEGVPDTIRQQYARAHTQDMWDLQTSGLDENAHNKRGIYDMEKMIAGRAAIKEGRTVPDVQADTWEHVRQQTNPETLTASRPHSDPKRRARGEYEKIPSLLSEDPQGNLRANHFWDAHAAAHADYRSDTARRLGIDF